MLSFLESSRCNLEIITFAEPQYLTEKLDIHLEQYKTKISSIEGRKIHIHGPFYDITVNSPDGEVVELSKKRYRQGLYVAKYLNAEKIIFHSQFNTQLRIEPYINAWLKATCDFFSGILEEKEYSDITILIENMFDDSPDLLRKVMDTVNSSRMGICMDVGHVNVYGHGDFYRWAGELAPYIKYLHMSDNNGFVDNHWPLGTGSLNFTKLFAALAKEKISPEFCLEVPDEKNLQQSLEYMDTLEDLGIYFEEL